MFMRIDVYKSFPLIKHSRKIKKTTIVLCDDCFSCYPWEQDYNSYLKANFAPKVNFTL